MVTQTRHITPLLALVIVVALAGCGEKKQEAPPEKQAEDTNQAPPKRQVEGPPKQQVEDAVRAALPPILSLYSIELEPIPTGPEAVKVNFKAIVVPKEDLCEVDREVKGTPTVTLLKVVQTAGAKASIYGSVEAHRAIDQWTLEALQIQVGLKQFGEPRGAFPAQSYVTGSNEANAALNQQAANAELVEREKKAAREKQELERKALAEQKALEEKARLEQEEQARIRREEQLKKEEEKRQQQEKEARQKLILATVKGTRYRGTIANRDKRQSIRLVITEQDGFLIRVEASNPDDPKEKRTFTGELNFNPQPEEDRPDVAYTILLSPVGGNASVWSNPFDCFYESNEGSLKLRLTDTGLEGEADIGHYDDYTIRLQREQ